jgi:hypothetical protein
MGDARYTKDGLVIPTRYLKGFGRKVRVQRSANVLIIETEERETARKKLGRMVRALRGSAAKLRAPTQSEIQKLVREVRKPVRVVIDTNVLVSGLISRSGPPARIVNAVLRGEIVPVMSEATL